MLLRACASASSGASALTWLSMIGGENSVCIYLSSCAYWAIVEKVIFLPIKKLHDRLSIKLLKTFLMNRTRLILNINSKPLNIAIVC